MTALDLVAAGAATMAGSCLALRGLMLKPDFHAWSSPPQRLSMSLLALAIVLGMAAVSILGGNHANAREAGVYVLEAIGAAVFLYNLIVPRESSRAQRAPVAPGGQAGRDREPVKPS